MGVVPKLRRLAVQTNVDNTTTQRQCLVVDTHRALVIALTAHESKRSPPFISLLTTTTSEDGPLIFTFAIVRCLSFSVPR